jgi:F0F1-type ATP synthase assembly protein I
MRDQVSKPDRVQYTKNLALAGFTGQIGFITLAIIIVALLAGLWLDSQMGTRPLFTILLLLASVPVTIFVMFRIALSFAAKIRPAGTPAAPAKEDHASDSLH